MLPAVAVLDDSSEFQQLLQAMLNYLGITEISAWINSQEALPALLASPPDLLLLDIMMGGIGGLDVWSRLRSAPETRQLPIILCTAAINSLVEDEMRLQQDPYTQMLPKPFTLDELKQAIAALIPHWNA
ncbi:MAG: response regulator [Herpetosiphonaceae bacterium]|nr:response regulator [Herpetosiphonaceae bacterium]